MDDAIQLDKLSVLTAMLKADASGKIGHFSTTKDIELGGMLAYDLEKLEPRLHPYVGKDIKITGKDRRAFKLAGPLSRANRPSSPLRHRKLLGRNLRYASRG